LNGFYTVSRLAAITKVLVKHGLQDLIQRLSGRQGPRTTAPAHGQVFFRSGFPSPRRIRLALEELGPSFIKLGQLMSTRADMFPPEYIREFRRLQDRVPPVAFAQVKAVIETELKRPLSEIFDTCNTEPVAAASVAQVHLARLKTGQPVALKVVRPGIHKKIREDIALMYYFADKLEDTIRAARAIGALNLVGEFERTIFKELDMFIEAGTVDKFARCFAQVEEIYIPKVYWEYTSKSVLAMEQINGIKLDEVDTIRSHGIDPKEIAMIGLRSFSRQLMEFGVFHADPHPANTIVMFDGRVAMIDFGIIGFLDEGTMSEIANILLGYAEHDYDMVLSALANLGLIDEQTIDLKDFSNDLKDMSEPFYGRSLKTVSVRDVHDEVMRLVIKYNIRLPRNLLLLLKTLIQTEALGKILDSDASILEVTKPYAKELLRCRHTPGMVWKNVTRDVRYMGEQFKTMPKLVNDVLKQIARGKQRFEVWHSGFKPFDIHFQKGINRLTVGFIISASLLAAAHILTSNRDVVVFTVDFLGLETISLTQLLGLIGFGIATVLGLWLIFSMFRSGGL
jgi:ubiquinone biosynthesis protein